MDGDAALPRTGPGSGPSGAARPGAGAPLGMRPGMGGGMGGPGGGFRGRPNPELLEGPITRTLIMFSLPLLGGNLLQSLNASVNQFWVAHLLGTTDITAIGNANSVMFLSLSAIMGATMAA